jgi:hypothetical protein
MNISGLAVSSLPNGRNLLLKIKKYTDENS